jgi:hypothetical protein
LANHILPLQKHFIKLLLRGEEVPPKVAETGRGYTLSGGLHPATHQPAPLQRHERHATLFL